MDFSFYVRGLLPSVTSLLLAFSPPLSGAQGRAQNQNRISKADQTIGVLFQYADYDGVGDESTKIDYDNMAKVNRMLALGLILLANSTTAPKWYENSGQTAPYVATWKRRHQPSSR